MFRNQGLPEDIESSNEAGRCDFTYIYEKGRLKNVRCENLKLVIIIFDWEDLYAK